MTPDGALVRRLLADELSTRADAVAEAVTQQLVNAAVSVSITAQGDFIEVACSSFNCRVPLEPLRERCIQGLGVASLVAQAALGLVEPEDDALITPALPVPTEVVRTRQDQRIQQALKDSVDVLLVGRSSSGKTRSAQIASRDWQVFGGTTSYLDLSSARASEFSLLVSLLNPRPSPSDHLVILDNLQSNPDLGSALLARLLEWRVSSPAAVKLLVVSWPAAADVVRRALPSVIEIACSGAEIATAIVNQRLPRNSRLAESVTRLADGDALVADLVSLHLKESRSTDLESLSAEDAARGAVARLFPSELSRGALELLIHLAALGVLEVEMDRMFATAIGGAPALEELESTGLVRPVGRFLSVGHRSLAWLILGHLEERLSTIADPAALAVDYLRAADDSQIRAMLSRLDLVSPRAGADQHGSQFLLQAWRSVGILQRYVAHQTTSDPTWGDNTASQVFAALCLASLGDVEAWDQVAEVVRSRWLLSPDGLPEPDGNLPKERVDFDEIYRTMKEEDELGVQLSWSSLTADDIDRDRMHRTWVLGLLMVFEGSAVKRDPGRIQVLRTAAEKVQDPAGWFYPSRVPWVTARVVLGLADMGFTVQSSDTVRRACDWLRSSPPDGPFDFGVWQAGTGRWNTDVMTTAMVVLALARAGVDPLDPCLQDAIAYLMSKRSEWSAPDKEIDTTLAIESLLASGRSWREMLDEIQLVLSWSKGQQPWLEATTMASESHTESSKVSLIASSLINVVWDTVSAELPLLLEGIVLAQKAKRRGDDIASTTARADPGSHESLDELAILARFIERSLDERSVTISGLGGQVPPPIEAALKRLRVVRRLLIDLEPRLKVGDEAALSDLRRLQREYGLSQ